MIGDKAYDPTLDFHRRHRTAPSVAAANRELHAYDFALHGNGVGGNAGKSTVGVTSAAGV